MLVPLQVFSDLMVTTGISRKTSSYQLPTVVAIGAVYQILWLSTFWEPYRIALPGLLLKGGSM